MLAGIGKSPMALSMLAGISKSLPMALSMLAGDLSIPRKYGSRSWESPSGWDLPIPASIFAEDWQILDGGSQGLPNPCQSFAPAL
ncbi:hypothetical protein QUF72_19570 [Desulfobacterales bacterium HSG2]|nr:hypothetical protein [Desulfobacterales bacterium HSG2]